MKIRATAALISAAAALSTAGTAHAALVSVSFEILGWSSRFAEHSTLFTDPAGAGAGAIYTTWQGGVVRFDGPGFTPTTANIPLAPGASSPLTQTSPGGVLHSTPVDHAVAAPSGATSVTFADRFGWRLANGAAFFSVWDQAATRNNVLSFNEAPPADVELGETFRLGTFFMRNGSWHSANNGAPDPVEITFRLTTRSADPLFNGFSLVDTFLFEAVGVPGGSALENADVFSLRGHPELGTVRVLEQSTGTIDLFGSINSLHLLGFGNATGGAVYSPATVAEPSSLAMLALSLASLAAMRRRQRSAGADSPASSEQ